jgi:hypothetical protein
MPPVDFLAVCFVLAMVLMGNIRGRCSYLSPDGHASGHVNQKPRKGFPISMLTFGLNNVVLVRSVLRYLSNIR